MLNYSVSEIDGSTMLVLSGTLAADGAEAFRSIARQITERSSIILNMENVAMVTSAGLDALVDVSVYARKHNRRVIILWADRDLVQMAEITGVYRHLIFAQSVEEAKMKLKYFT